MTAQNTIAQNSNAQPPIVFQHLFKSGGTSVIERMRGIVGRDRLLHVKSVAALTAMAQKDPEKLASYAVIAGHLPLPAIDRLFPGAALMTILRDPVDRIVSQYFHFRREGLDLQQASQDAGTQKRPASKGHLYRSRFCATHDFEAYVLDDSSENTTYTRNYAARALAGMRGTKRPTQSPILHQARANLKRFSLVMTTEDIDARFDDAFRALALDRGLAQDGGLAAKTLRSVIPRERRRNVSALRSREATALSDDALAALIAWNQFDYALYAEARWL